MCYGIYLKRVLTKESNAYLEFVEVNLLRFVKVKELNKLQSFLLRDPVTGGKF